MPETNVVTITDLHKHAMHGCTECGEDHTRIFMHSNCHPHAGVIVSYDRIDFLLRFDCAECNAAVIHLFADVPEI